MRALATFREQLLSFMHSIRFRLVLWFVLILAVVLAAFSLFVYFSQARDLRSASIDYLERRIGRLQEILSSNASQPGGNNAVLIVPTDFLQDTDELVLLDQTGNVLTSHGPLQADEALQLVMRGLHEQSQHGKALASTTWTQENDPIRTEYSFVIAPLSDDVRYSGFIILGRPLDTEGQLQRLVLTLLAGSLLTLVIALLGGLWLADRAMRPVKAITQTARQISDTDLSLRLNMKNKDELGELADTFDAMLARLQAAFERQREFVADASHELRTPLTIVNLEANHALATRRRPQEYERAMEVIQSENNFMIRLVNDLLALARMDAGQTTLEQNLLDLSDLALEAVERLSSLAERSHVRMETGDLPEVMILGDRQALLQMISNLLENGIKYASGENSTIHVETGSTDDKAWLRVADNGPGIPPEHIPHLFERFYRVDKARSRMDQQSPSGSGLGLSIVQWVATAHNGTVNVTSVLGEGTTFDVTFPSAGPSN
jgi:two-component system OmpR family sensor kinase